MQQPGGDSAVRGLLAGMVFGSHLGFDAVNPDWIEQIAYRERIEKAMEALR